MNLYCYIVKLFWNTFFSTIILKYFLKGNLEVNTEHFVNWIIE